jgi:hypothetical protein
MAGLGTFSFQQEVPVSSGRRNSRFDWRDRATSPLAKLSQIFWKNDLSITAHLGASEGLLRLSIR